MTEKELIKNFTKIKKDFSKTLDKRSVQLIKSGAMDLTKYENDFLLPKIVLTACLKELCDSYMPFSDEARKEVFNLMKF
jgi:hypothetical protein